MATERNIPERKVVKAKLREANMTHRQVDALLRKGWRGLVSEAEAELAEAKEAKQAQDKALEQALERLQSLSKSVK